jgi:hypothetical protein
MKQPEWNDKIGLWAYAGPGHTTETKDLATLHPAPNSATQLVVDAVEKRLDKAKAAAVFQAIRSMQIRDGSSFHGCMKWYWEETKIHDTNASFFTGLGLLVLNGRFPDALGDSAIVLRDILEHLLRWFLHAVREKMFYYPNKYLGDLVCAWLISEQSGKHQDTAEREVADALREAGRYWHEHGWGWGEHMSGGYAAVCMDEISLLLLFSKRLPPDVRAQYTALLNELLAIGDAYEGGPRVPTIRSYDFAAAPSFKNYRDTVGPWEVVKPSSPRNMPPLGALFHDMGWHQMVSARQKSQRHVVVRCYGGHKAEAELRDDLRIGGMSGFPLMTTAEHHVWGLSWQSFPMAMWHRKGDWGFLQWETVEGGKVRAHPANPGPVAYIPKALTESMMPPVTGRTFCLQSGGNWLALRIMPVMVTTWERLTDRFRLVGCAADIAEGACRKEEGWYQWLLRYPERTVGISYVALMEGASPRHESRADGVREWNVDLTHERLSGLGIMIGLWAFRIDGPVESAPLISKEPNSVCPSTLSRGAWHIRWTWPGVSWNVTIQPLASSPLISDES